MESDPKKPEGAASDQKSGGDAAAMSARILAMKGDSDEYTYTEPLPNQVSPVVNPKDKRRGVFAKIAGMVGIFLVGACVSVFAIKFSISHGWGIGAKLDKWLGTPPVAIINGEVISAEDFAHASEITGGRSALQRIIDNRLVLQYSRKIGVYPDPKDVDAKFTEMTRSPSFFQNLKRSNQSQEDFKYNLLVSMCRQAIVSKGIKVNPSEIQAYYQKNIDPKNPTARFFHPETVQAAVIINPSMEALENAQKQMAEGMTWATAALKFSADYSKSRSGVLPPLTKAQIDPARFPGLAKIMFDMHDGQTSDIVKIQNRYWLIRCLNHNQEKIDPYDKVQEQCTSGLLVERGLKSHGEEITKDEQAFVKASNITIYPAYAGQYGDLSPKH